MPIDQLTRLGTTRTIVRWGDPILHRAAQPVTDFGDDLQNLLCDMFATNTAAHGAGLAAPQIGVDVAAFVYDCVDVDLRRQVGVVCNPVVELPEGRDRDLETWDEGCLSLPGGYAELARPNLAICRGEDQYGDLIELTGTGCWPVASSTRLITSRAWSSVIDSPAGAAAASTKATAKSPTATLSPGPSPPLGLSSQRSERRQRVVVWAQPCSGRAGTPFSR